MLNPYHKPERKKKPAYISKRMQELNAQYHAALEEIDQERQPICQGCGKAEFEHSHSIPRNYQNYAFLAEKKNIWRLCRECHVHYEAGRVWKLKCGQRLMRCIWELDEQYYRQKVEKMRQRISEENEKNWLSQSQGLTSIPQWASEMIEDE